MSIKDTLKTLADQQTSLASFFYGTDYEANVRADDAAFPMLHVQTIVNSGAEFSQSGAARRTYPVFLFFCEQGDIDMTTDEMDAKVEAMKDEAIQYVARINKTRLFDNVAAMQFKTLHYKFDNAVCGVLTMITLRDRSGSAVCV